MGTERTKDQIESNMRQDKINVDSKRRVTLGKLADGISSYSIEELDGGKLLLTPFVEIPAEELWLWNNKDALSAVKLGLEQSAKGQTKTVDWRQKLSGK